MANGQGTTKQPDLADILVTELKRLDETGQRRPSLHAPSPTSAICFRDAISMEAVDPEKRAEMAIEIIRNSYLDGYDEGVHIVELRRFCEQYGIKPNRRLQFVIEYGKRW